MAREWELRKAREQMANWNGTVNGSAFLASGEVGDDLDSYIPPHDDDRLIAGCDYVAFCPNAGWIELGGEG